MCGWGNTGTKGVYGGENFLLDCKKKLSPFLQDKLTFLKFRKFINHKINPS